MRFFAIHKSKRLVLLLSLAVGIFWTTCISAGIASAYTLNPRAVDAAHIHFQIMFNSNDLDNEGLLTNDAVELGINTINNLVDAQVEGTFTDVDINDSEEEWVNEGEDCSSRIRREEGDIQLVSLRVRPASGGCIELLGDDIVMDGHIDVVDNLSIWFRWSNENTLVRVDGWGGNFVELDPENFPGRFFRVEETGECRDYLSIGPAQFTRGIYHENCRAIRTVRIGSVTERSNPPGPTDPSGAGGAGGENQPSCERDGGELSWILCPVLRMTDDFVSWTDEQINNMLQVPNSYFQGSTAATNLRTTWARLRNIAYVILIPVMLIMVISTALGFELFSSYTVKRALPRLIAAILFMALSYDIATFLIVVTNNVGAGLMGLMTSAFSGGPITLASLFDPNFAAGGLFTGGVVLAVGAGAIAGPGVLLSFALVTAVSLLLGMLALALRQMFLIALILLAPLAILAWIFPGNDKMWKLWWGSFSKLLLLYPVIVVLIATGRIFAQVVQNTTVAGDDPALTGFLGTILKLIAYLAPYFLIPATFRFAGGAFSTLTGMVNDKRRGLFDRQKKYRAETWAKNKGLAGRSARWNPNSVAGKMFNAPATWLADPRSGAHIALKTGKGKSIMNQVNQARMDHSQKLAGQMSGLFNNKALERLGSWDGSKKGLDNLIAEMEAEGGAANDMGAKQLRDNASFLRDIHTSDETGRASVKAAAGLALASQGFATPDSIAATAEALDGSDSRFKGLGSMFKTQSELMNAKAGGLTKPGLSVIPERVYNADTGEWDLTGRYIAGAGATGPQTQQQLGASIHRLQSINVGDVTGAKGGALEGYEEAYRTVLSSPVNTAYVDQDGNTQYITQDMKDSVEHVLSTASVSYNNPDIAQRTTRILREGLGDEGYARLMGRRGRRGAIPEDELHRITAPPPDDET